jgi:hypothetical protein
MVHRFGTGSHEAQDERMNAAAVDDPRSVVRKMLEEIAPCETGYPGVSWCKICGGGQWCADLLERELSQRLPSMDWMPAIREVLGM